MSETVKLNIICPSCQKTQVLHIPRTVVKNSGGLATIDVKAVCGHNFHIYLDQNFKIRGYQSADFEFISELEEVDRKISSLIDDEKMQELIKNSGDGLKNYFNAELFQENLRDLLYIHDGLNPIQLTSTEFSKGDKDAKTINAETSDAESDEDLKAKQAEIKSFKEKYEARMKKIKDLIYEIGVGKMHGVPDDVLNQKKEELVRLRQELHAFAAPFVSGEFLNPKS
ncbi:MAG: hypothetical protein ACTSWN_16875 [Promethearchaeota archaeon]